MQLPTIELINEVPALPHWYPGEVLKDRNYKGQNEFGWNPIGPILQKLDWLYNFHEQIEALEIPQRASRN